MTKQNSLTELAISDTGFVFDPRTGATFNVNATGLALLEGIKSGLSRRALLLQLCRLFETGERDLERDLDEFIHLLRRANLVPHDFALEV